MKVTVRMVRILAMLLTLSQGSFAEQNVVPHVTEAGGERSLVNPLPINIAVYLSRRDANGKLVSGETIILAAGSSKQLPRKDVRNIERLEIIDESVVRRPEVPLACQPEGLFSTPQISIAAIEEELKRFDFRSTREGRATIETARQIAGVERERKLDAVRTRRADPYERTLRSQAEDDYTQRAVNYYKSGGTGPYVDVERDLGRIKETSETIGDALVVAASLFGELSAKESAKRDILQDEIKALAPHVENLRTELLRGREILQIRAREAAAGAQFLNTAYNGFTGRTSEPSTESFRLASQPERTCAGSATLDYAKVEIESEGANQVLMSEVTFNKGPAQKTFFRRIRGSNTWIGQFFWPNQASVASFKVKSLSDKAWKKVPGTVAIGSMSPAMSLSSLEEAFKKVEKEFKSKKSQAQSHNIHKVMPTP